MSPQDLLPRDHPFPRACPSHLPTAPADPMAVLTSPLRRLGEEESLAEGARRVERVQPAAVEACPGEQQQHGTVWERRPDVRLKLPLVVAAAAAGPQPRGQPPERRRRRQVTLIVHRAAEELGRVAHRVRVGLVHAAVVLGQRAHVDAVRRHVTGELEEGAFTEVSPVVGLVEHVGDLLERLLHAGVADVVEAQDGAQLGRGERLGAGAQEQHREQREHRVRRDEQVLLAVVGDVHQRRVHAQGEVEVSAWEALQQLRTGGAAGEQQSRAPAPHAQSD